MATVSLWQVHATRSVVTRLGRAFVNVNFTATSRETGGAEALDTVTCNGVITDYHNRTDVFIMSDHNVGTPFDIRNHITPHSDYFL
jgi:hypothetical protein